MAKDESHFYGYARVEFLAVKPEAVDLLKQGFPSSIIYKKLYDSHKITMPLSTLKKYLVKENKILKSQSKTNTQRPIQNGANKSDTPTEKPPRRQIYGERAKSKTKVDLAPMTMEELFARKKPREDKDNK